METISKVASVLLSQSIYHQSLFCMSKEGGHKVATVGSLVYAMAGPFVAR